MQSPPIPTAFLDRMQATLGAEFHAFIDALENPAEGLRVNSLRIGAGEFERISPFDLLAATYPPGGFLVMPGQRPGRHPYHAAGLYYLQDPGAMVVAALVDPQPGERILDISAAPGGKSTHLAALMGGEGVLVANDVSASRARELLGNIERCGVRNAYVTSESPERLAAHFGSWFDRVLVDAPCSGESMFHKSAAARADWSPESVLGCAHRQEELLETAAKLVAPGGLLVYSTCTFSPEENEGVLESFLDRRPDFRSERLSDIPGGDLSRFGSDGTALRLWPHRFAGAGHFVAGLRRFGDEEERTSSADRPAAPPSETALRDFRAFWRDAVGGEEAPDRGRLFVVGQQLHLLPDDAPGVQSLRVLRSGLHLGTFERGRFEPAHALAMAAPLPAFTSIADFEPDDPRIDRYLAGHPIDQEGAPGWTVVSVGGFALGWGKRVGSTIKNHYPKGLREAARG